MVGRPPAIECTNSVSSFGYTVHVTPKHCSAGEIHIQRFHTDIPARQHGVSSNTSQLKEGVHRNASVLSALIVLIPFRSGLPDTYFFS